MILAMLGFCLGIFCLLKNGSSSRHSNFASLIISYNIGLLLYFDGMQNVNSLISARRLIYTTQND